MAIHTMQEKINELRKRREKAMQGGGADKLDKQRKQGKLTARDE
jgi:acetyl-CoA/propionyl-CoA carboxylase carboxyl transferase subunit